MKLFEKPWLKIINIKFNDIVTASVTDNIGDFDEETGGGITDDDKVI